MARLFATEQDQQFFNDLTKEFIKDVLGFFVYVFPVSSEKTATNELYDEAIDKVFENPIRIDCIPDQPERSRKMGIHGIDNASTLKIYVQPRDLIDKNIKLYTGDFLLFGDEMYEIDTVVDSMNIYGRPEHKSTITLECHLARTGQIDLDIFKQMIFDSKHWKDSQVLKKFEQQRGYSETEEHGETGDVRQVRNRLKEELAPIALGEGPRKTKVYTDGDDDLAKETANRQVHTTHHLYDE